MNAADGALLDAVRSLRWPARRKAPAGLAGDHRSWMRGISTEFEDYRAYRQGDDVSKIDWKLLARRDRAYIRLSTERTVLPTMIVLDASASMAFPAATLEKWHFARHVVLGLASAAHSGRDPVGIAVATGQPGGHYLPARTRRGIVHQILALLAQVEPGGTPPVAPVFDTVARRNRRARIAIVSDFLGDADELLKRATQHAAAGREVHAIHTIHTTEMSPPTRPALVVDPEAAQLKRPLTDLSRQRYLENFGDWRERLARDWRMAGASYTQVVTFQGAPQAVRRIVRPPETASRA
ncbi:MAG: DUF58 domain-containing protein [Gemmatimonadetes bacterium]|nr:DUF58 domain-containing protein [Gemmatimonadota bacterium]MYB97717.1 DUF58 domain-containing protein [Gemmatimonadota bacterium]